MGPALGSHALGRVATVAESVAGGTARGLATVSTGLERLDRSHATADSARSHGMERRNAFIDRNLDARVLSSTAVRCPGYVV